MLHSMGLGQSALELPSNVSARRVEAPTLGGESLRFIIPGATPDLGGTEVCINEANAQRTLIEALRWIGSHDG